MGRPVLASPLSPTATISFTASTPSWRLSVTQGNGMAQMRKYRWSQNIPPAQQLLCHGNDRRIHLHQCNLPNVDRITPPSQVTTIDGSIQRLDIERDDKVTTLHREADCNHHRCKLQSALRQQPILEGLTSSTLTTEFSWNIDKHWVEYPLNASKYPRACMTRPSLQPYRFEMLSKHENSQQSLPSRTIMIRLNCESNSPSA